MGFLSEIKVMGIGNDWKPHDQTKASMGCLQKTGCSFCSDFFSNQCVIQYPDWENT